MANFEFIHATMRSGKSLDLLKTAYQYKERGANVLLLTHEADIKNNPTKSAQQTKGVIKTRLGLSADAWIVGRICIAQKAREECPCIVLVDEAHFLSEAQVLSLAKLVDEQGINVSAYGLKTDFQGNFFPGSQALFQYATNLKEIETGCWYCPEKATMNLRTDQAGAPVFNGPQILVGDNYYPVCRQCYLQFKWNDDLRG